MTHLRQIMLEELRRRNYAESTIHAYIHTVEHFSRHFHRSPDQLGPEHIRQYQSALFTRWKLAPNTVTQRLAALRFFYVQVLKRGWSVAETPYPRKVLHLPQVLSQEEVARLIDAAEFPITNPAEEPITSWLPVHPRHPEPRPFVLRTKFPNKDGSESSLQKRLHVCGFHRKPPHNLTGCVVEGRCDRWRCKSIRRFGTSAVSTDFRVVEQHDFYLWYVRHF